ncbi:hypothetical protein M430DRAFT_33525, partial [Amorphotheca resinae ATCC 22711]
MMQTTIPPPRLEPLLAPLLSSLPAASISPQPPTALLPLLSPILRQRVQLLSATDSEPWLPLLCYDSSKASKLETVAKSERLEPHPVSGEVEIDWEFEAGIRYKRLDEETLQALVTIPDLGLRIRLVWCVNDEVGGGDGWRIGEVSVLEDNTTDDDASWGEVSILIAESTFQKSTTTTTTISTTTTHPNISHTSYHENHDDAANDDDDDDDDDYWAQYDKTPGGHTPAPKRSPAPPGAGHPANDDDEASYYAQYASVQPALDNHDPDEARQNGDVESSLGHDEISRELRTALSSAHILKRREEEEEGGGGGGGGGGAGLAQPRPGSSTGSSGSDTVARLEIKAAQSAARVQSELGIKQHISSSLKSLYKLAKVVGIERGEFESLVRTELDCLALLDED